MKDKELREVYLEFKEEVREILLKLLDYLDIKRKPTKFDPNSYKVDWKFVKRKKKK